MEEYNKQILYLSSKNSSYLHLDKCSENDIYLICTIEKEDIEEVLQYNGQKFEVFSIHNDEVLYKINLINNISIIDDIQKQDIYLSIVRLLQYKNYVHETNYIAYETNVTNIENVVTGKTEFKKYNCYLKKSGNSPLLFLINGSYIGDRDEIIYINLNIKYNFIIQIDGLKKSCYIGSEGSIASFVYPKVLNFSLAEELHINYVMNSQSLDR